MSFSRFDRHEVFNQEDTSFVLDCIKQIDKYDYENSGAELANMLYGLFDGYYYDKIHTYAYELLNTEMYNKLQYEVFTKIEKFIQTAYQVN
jgi:hypothetical protein